MTEKIKIKINFAHEDAVLPKQGKANDNCYDLVSVSMRYDEEKGYYEYDTGIIIQPPVDYGTKIYPRSSISNVDLFFCNSPGQIDPDYANTLKCRFKPTKPNPRIYGVGDKIAQLEVFKRREIDFEIVEEIVPRGERKTGGFGSTGR